MAVLLPKHPELLASQDAWWLAAWSVYRFESKGARRETRVVREPDLSALRPQSLYQKTFKRAWLVHRALDAEMRRFTATLPVLDSENEGRNELLAGLVSDAQLSGLAYDVALHQSRLVFRALLTPDGMAWASWFGLLIHFNSGQLLQAGRYDLWLLSQGADTALNARARNLGSELDATWLRGPVARQLTGDLMPWVVSLSEQAVSAYGGQSTLLANKNRLK